MALSATELRIGNWVFNKAHERKQVKEVFAYCSVYDPIPLTEEWLLRFGFEEHKIHGYYFKDCGEYEIRIVINAFSGSLDSESSWFVSIQTGYYSQPVTLVRKYVHEIQNLFFVLNEEELSYEKT